MAIDCERFNQITRGLHVFSTLEQKFEEVNAVFESSKEITLLYQISPDLILVNAPISGAIVLSAKDLKELHKLDTQGEVAFCAK